MTSCWNKKSPKSILNLFNLYPHKFFKMALRVTKYFGYFYEKNCCQKFSKSPNLVSLVDGNLISKPWVRRMPIVNQTRSQRHTSKTRTMKLFRARFLSDMFRWNLQFTFLNHFGIKNKSSGDYSGCNNQKIANRKRLQGRVLKDWSQIAASKKLFYYQIQHEILLFLSLDLGNIKF